MHLPARYLVVLAAFGAMLSPHAARASTISFGFTGPGEFSFAGTFVHDNDVVLVSLVLPTQTLLTAETTSYALGGFDPSLWLFGPSGDKLFQNDDRDSATGDWDSLLQPGLLLGPGTYTLALTQYPNFAHLTLASGFDFDDTEFFTWDAYGGGTTECSAFVDFDGNCRTSAFAASVSLREVSPVPEPATLTLLGSGIAGLLLRRRACRRARLR